MELFKFALGPYELFASVIGGLPLVLAVFLLYNPGISLQKLIALINSSFSLQVMIIFFVLSYLLGGVVQGMTWKFFLMLCRVFRQDFHYFKEEMLLEKHLALKEAGTGVETRSLDFEDRLVLLLQEKVGIPRKINWLYPRLHAYLKENNRPSLVSADLYQATHIMYRNLSFGCLIVGVIILINLVRLQMFSFEQLAFSFLFITLSYIAFLRSLSFKRWYSREIMLGFYFAASQ